MQEIFDRSLVKTEAAASFLQLACTESGCKAFLGDPEKYDENVRQYMSNALAVLRDGALKIGALVSDPTRTTVQKHEAARSVAEKVITFIHQSKSVVVTRAAILASDAQAKAETEFAPSASRASLDSEIRGWIREQVKLPDGPAKVRDEAMANKDVAAVLWHSPRFLIGLSKGTLDNLRTDLLEQHLPGAYRMFEASGALSDLVPKLDMAAKSVERSFYNGAVADQAKLRVLVD